MADEHDRGEFGPDEDTHVEIDPAELVEVSAEEKTPTRPAEYLQGYERGRRDEQHEFFQKWGGLLAAERRIGKAEVLQELRDQLAREGNAPEVIDHIVGRLGAAVGVQLT